MNEDNVFMQSEMEMRPPPNYLTTKTETMEFKKQFKEAHPETIGETDSHFDKSNYIDWIDKEYAQIKADKAELLEALERHKDALDLSNMDFYIKYGFNVAEVMPKTRVLIQKMK